MKNIPYLSSMFLHMILTLLVTEDDSPPAYPPGDLITIACGPMIVIACRHTDPQILNDRSWIRDRHSIYSPSEEHQVGNTSITKDAPLSSSSSASQVPHLATFPLPPKTHQLTESDSSSSSSSDEKQEEEKQHLQKEEGKEKGLIYGLRENAKRSFRLADLEFSFVDPGLVIQDNESETESRSLTRRRSKRNQSPMHL
ncbi:hypothetical protein ACFX15_012462 [Malus domestica]